MKLNFDVTVETFNKMEAVCFIFLFYFFLARTLNKRNVFFHLLYLLICFYLQIRYLIRTGKYWIHYAVCLTRMSLLYWAQNGLRAVFDFPDVCLCFLYFYYVVPVTTQIPTVPHVNRDCFFLVCTIGCHVYDCPRSLSYTPYNIKHFICLFC